MRHSEQHLSQLLVLRKVGCRREDSLEWRGLKQAGEVPSEVPDDAVEGTFGQEVNITDRVSVGLGVRAGKARGTGWV